MKDHEVPRMSPQSDMTNPNKGTVVWSPGKSLWFAAHLFIAAVGGWMTFSASAAMLSFVFTVVTLCLGHTLGLHRLLIHRSFACPRWLEYLLVHLGTVVGMGGPFRIIYMHDVRDWAQRHESCHPFFIHQNPLWKDFLWQLHCEIRLLNPPRFQIERSVANNPFHRFLQQTWMLQQVPWGALFYAFGGIELVIWCISVRITISLIGHWLVGYFAHNAGSRDWHLRGHAVQGHNVPRIGLLTMGESWHNNHHAFPGSARLGLSPKQPDPGWWALRILQTLGLAWNIKLPADLPERPELVALNLDAQQPLTPVSMPEALESERLRAFP